MGKLFNLQVYTGGGGYGVIDTEEELIDDIIKEFGNSIVNEIKDWINSDNAYFENKCLGLCVYRL